MTFETHHFFDKKYVHLEILAYFCKRFDSESFEVTTHVVSVESFSVITTLSSTTTPTEESQAIFLTPFSTIPGQDTGVLSE